jgi:RNA 3'-terminal phosphate cyclase (ATP)
MHIKLGQVGLRQDAGRSEAWSEAMADFLTLDGSHGEGGGQILRTALSLSIMTSRPFRLVNIRMGRRTPGLLPQHLSAVRAAAAVSGASLSGDDLGSTELTFAPSHQPRAGRYVVDVAEMTERGSAGSVTLILQTLVVPLALAEGASEVIVHGGTHVEWSPPFDHFAVSYLSALRRMGLQVEAQLRRWGWYPIGKGEVVCTISGRSMPGEGGRASPCPIEALERGALRRVGGRAVAANLQAHIPQRMADRAHAALADLGVPVEIAAQRVSAACAGAGIFVHSEYESWTAAFSAYGRIGTPSEAVADEAIAALREHHASGAAVELHLADQLLLPLSVAGGPSTFTTVRSTRHLATNAWVIGKFGVADVAIEPSAVCRVRVEPRQRH